MTLDDPFYPLRDAVNLPPPLTPGGPPIWLGGQRPRGFRMAARLADGWVLPGRRRTKAWPSSASGATAILRELEAIGRDPATFTLRRPAPDRDGRAADRARARDGPRSSWPPAPTTSSSGCPPASGRTG